MNVDDLVAERIAAARARIAAAKARRTTQAAARQAGLVHRHRAKLANLAASEGYAHTVTPAEANSVHEADEKTGGTTP